LQAKGSLSETKLRSLLEEAQTERATGTLTLRDNGRMCTLYFLFGHLFHALNEGMTGDDAVVSALGWDNGDFDFDPKAKLPADETVKATIPELVDSAGSDNSADHPAADHPAPAPETPEPPRHGRGDREAAAEAPPPAPSAEHPGRHQPEPEHQREDSGPRRGVKHRPQPKHGREPIPVPAGRVTYDSLKTSFVDFPRLITTLEKEAYTGYVRLLTDEATGLIFFREGAALECIYDVGEKQSLQLGRSALQSFNDDVTHGQGVLDVVELSPELIDGLYELTVAKPKYTDLYASWVDMTALLKFLKDRKLSGSVMVRSASGTGVIILTDGDLTGAYTSESRDISAEPDGVLALCADAEAMIEVKSADAANHTPLQVDEVVGGRRSAPPSRSAREPEPPAPAFASAPPAPPPAPVQSSPPAPARTAPSNPPASTTQHLHAVHAGPPMPAEPARQAPSGNGADWEQVISTLQGMAEEALGNRSRKVKDILAGAEHSRGGVENAINQIPTISLLFVDSSRLEALAQEMRARLDSLV
jgi:hypothetical protein